MLKPAHITNSFHVIKLIASLSFVLFLSACSANQLSLGSEKKANPDEIVLDEKGLPSIAQLMKAGPLPEMYLGKDTAPVTVIEYVSLTCPHCRAFHQKTLPFLKANYINKGKVRYIVREFPIGRSAGNAAIVTRCGSPKRYFKMVDLFLNNQSKWVSQEVRLDAIYTVAKKSGLKRAEFDQCMKDQTLIDNLNTIKNRGRKLGVTGTPTFFINGQKFRKPLSIEEIKTIIDAQLKLG